MQFNLKRMMRGFGRNPQDNAESAGGQPTAQVRGGGPMPKADIPRGPFGGGRFRGGFDALRKSITSQAQNGVAKQTLQPLQPEQGQQNTQVPQSEQQPPMQEAQQAPAQDTAAIDQQIAALQEQIAKLQAQKGQA